MIVFGSAQFGQGSGSIVERFTCSGTEQRLIDCCYILDEPDGYCSHRRDVGVRCCKCTTEC